MKQGAQMSLAMLTVLGCMFLMLLSFAENLGVPFSQEYIFMASWVGMIAGIIWFIRAWRMG